MCVAGYKKLSADDTSLVEYIILKLVVALFALTQGPHHATAVIAMYVAVHFIEGNFITPIIQSEATSLPPVVTLLSVITCGLLLGPPRYSSRRPWRWSSSPRSRSFTLNLRLCRTEKIEL